MLERSRGWCYINRFPLLLHIVANLRVFCKAFLLLRLGHMSRPYPFTLGSLLRLLRLLMWKEPD